MSGEEVSRAPVEARSTPATSSAVPLLKAGEAGAGPVLNGVLDALMADRLTRSPMADLEFLKWAVLSYVGINGNWSGIQALRRRVGLLLSNTRAGGDAVCTREELVEVLQRLRERVRTQGLSIEVYLGLLVHYTVQGVYVSCMSSRDAGQRKILQSSLLWVQRNLGRIQCTADRLSEEERFVLFVQHDSPF